MTGIVIVTHSRLGDALIEAAEFILDSKLEAVTSVSVNLNENAEKLHKNILGGIEKVNQNRGVLILTDMFGGTPSNLSYSFLEEGRIEVLTGINLPILIKALNIRDKKSLADTAKELEDYGKKSISLASGILKGNKRS
ncbi:MAG: PTS sugar transporter subunit IIA [Deltaproteobacteria bacterium]|nr:PTS sugar transporter subunit IIA [Deltaproteobacteria bacterium]MBW2220549.1 PTS sugar transporter subunit IIA [Deltaproteobacteria bacterium]